MTDTLLHLSDKIEAVCVALLENVVDIAARLKIAFFVVGATARDMILIHGYNIQTIQATYDIDLGVQVSDWKEYQRLTNELMASGHFSKGAEYQKFSYKGIADVDILPFGAISLPDGSLSWPPENEVIMNVLGFEESYRHSLKVRLRNDPILDIQFASLAGLVVMKLLAWENDRASRRKDAQDLSLILQKYLEAGNEDRLYSEEVDLLEQEHFDYIFAGARLLGRDVASMLSPESQEMILAILERETREGEQLKLVEDMVLVDATLIGDSEGDDFEKKLLLLHQFKLGMLDRMRMT